MVWPDSIWFLAQPSTASLEQTFYTVLMIAGLLFIKWGSEKLEKKKIAAKVEDTAATLAKTVEKSEKKVVEKIEENTELSKQAFNEANNFNTKLVELEKCLAEMRRIHSRSIPKKIARKKRMRVQT